MPQINLIILLQSQTLELNLLIFCDQYLGKYQKKKRKYKQENRIFHKWVENFAFIDNNGKSLCLTFKVTITNHKVSNLNQHYRVVNPTFQLYPLNSKLQTEKFKSFQSSLHKQQTLSSSFSCEDDRANEASFFIAWNITCGKHPYAECIKRNLEEVAKVLDPWIQIMQNCTHTGPYVNLYN